MAKKDDFKRDEMLGVLYQRSAKTWSEMYKSFASGVREDKEILKEYGFDPEACNEFLIGNMYFTAAHFVNSLAELTGITVEEALEMIEERCLLIKSLPLNN